MLVRVFYTHIFWLKNTFKGRLPSPYWISIQNTLSSSGKYYTGEGPTRLKTALETRGKTAKWYSTNFFNVVNSILLSLFSCLSFGLQTGFLVFFLLANPSPCIRFPCPVGLLIILKEENKPCSQKLFWLSWGWHFNERLCETQMFWRRHIWWKPDQLQSSFVCNWGPFTTNYDEQQ